MKNNFTEQELNHLFIQAAEYFGFESSAIIEKDYYVTQAIQLFSNLEDENFRLIFSGGTCLAKAHQIIDRMSEDIDFKIQFKTSMNRSQYKANFRIFRHTTIEATLNNSIFTYDSLNVRNEGRYVAVELNYNSSSSLSSGLHPHILLEFTESQVKLPTQHR